MEYLIIVPHRRMYRLKVKKGWVDERSKKIVRIDTAVSAASEKMALDWKWHLPVLALTAATVFLVVEGERRFHVSWAEAWPIWLLYGTGVGLCLLFLGMHLAVVRRPNRVYSDHTEINLAANRLMKRSWTEGLVYASWLNGASWIWMAFWYFYCGLDLPGTAYGIYTALLLLEAAALLFPLARSVRKRQGVLEADTSACYIDDDEYWKYGWYNNPRCEVLGLVLVAVHFALVLAEEGVARMHVDALFAGHQGERERIVLEEFFGRPCAAGIVARRLDAARQALRALEPEDVVALPAVDGDRHVFERRDRRIRVYAERGIGLFCFLIAH